MLCRNRALRWEEVKPLFESQRSFQYLPESVWKDCREENGALICQNRTFEAVMTLDGAFPSVSRDVFSVPPDCACEPAQPHLRAARLKFHGRAVWLLVNESLEKPLEADIRFPASAPLGKYDLWQNQIWRLESRADGKCRRARICLAPNESLLIFSCDSQAEWDALPKETAPAVTLRNRDFTFESENKALHQITYSAHVPACLGPLLISLSAQEMAEVFLNDECFGAAFWPPQRIMIPGSRLPRGAFTLRLTVTGSKACQYGSPVWYGLG